MRIAFEQPDNVVYDKLNLDTACSSSEGLIHSTTLVAGDNTLTVHIGRQTDNGNISIGDIAGIVVTDLGEGVTDVESVMKGNNSSIWTRSEFTLDVENAELDYTSLVLQMQYEDGFVAYLNGTEVASSDNAPSPVAWDSSAASDRVISPGYEDFNITDHLDLLHSGTNILAIQGLNNTVSDGEFLILPKLIAGGNRTEQLFLLDASPGQTNGDSKYYVGDTTFNFNRGFYDSAFGLEITSASPGVEIRYTTDGSTPSESYGDVYSTPINIGGTTCVRAMAHRDGWVSTNVDTQTFIFLDDVLGQTKPDGYPDFWGPAAHDDGPYSIGDPVLADYAMDPDVDYGQSHTDNYENAFGVRDALLSLPTLSLVTDKAELFDPSGIYLNTLTEDLECPVSMELFYPDGSKDCQEDAGLRIYGGVGRSPEFRKHSMRIAFRSQYGASKLRFDVFDGKATDEFDTLILRAGSNWSWHGWEGQWANTQFVTDEIARRFQLAMGQPSAYGTFVHVYLNGMYWGMYNLVERPVADFAATYLGGEEEDYDALNSGFVKEGDAVAWDAAQAIADAVLAGSKTVEQGYQELSQYVDFGNLIDFLMVQFYGGNGDWDSKNWYATRLREPGAGYMFYAWDSEDFLQCGVTQNDRTELNNNNAPTRLYTALRDHPEFKLLFADHAQKHLRNGGVMSPEGATAQFSELVDLVDRATVAESARWGDAREYRPDAGTFTREDHFIPKRESIFNVFLPGRSEVLIGFLRGADLYPSFDPPIFNVNGSPQHGGYLFSGDIVSLSLEGAGKIYYTIDGRDPRDNEFPDEGDVRRVFIPTSDIGDTWKSDLGFDDSSWISGIGGIGYEDSVGYDSYINIDVETQMQGVNPGCYVRIPFSLSAEFLSSIETLKIMVRYDDGFVAYVNGTEIAHANAPGRDGNTDPLIWSSPATHNHSDTEAVQWQIIDVSNSIGDLVAGDNLLAIHAMDVSLTSSDFLISVKFDVEIEESPSEINMTKSTHVRARAYSEGLQEWSALTEATYSIGPIVENLRITEVMYHPADPNAAELAVNSMFGDDDFEYVELQNTGTETINLNLVSFIDGIYYTFGDVDLAPDEYIVVVENRDAFEARYGTGLNMADGVYTGSLSNSGEKIRLRDAVDTKVLTFDYYDYWYDMTDGDGFSLTIRDAYAADPNLWDEKAGWRPSSVIDGSPGEDDPDVIPELGAIVINEVLAHSNSYPNDWVELYNTTGAPIDVSGWFLSDNSDSLYKYEIAAGTYIEAYGYLVFTQDDHFGGLFGLSENGEIVILSSPVGTGYIEQEDFGASLPDVAFGRYEKSIGTFNFVAMSANTPGASYEGAANAYPEVGPIIINEIMYHPTDVDGDAEYIELKNISGGSVTLYDGVGVGWEITNGVTYSFPTGGSAVTIEAGEYFLLIKDWAVFTAAYGAPICDYAEWIDSSLNNGGEKVEISQPGDEVAGVRQYIRVDRVSYSDGLDVDDDWPTDADGQGKSLGRMFDSDYGNDVANWEAVDASPGE